MRFFLLYLLLAGLTALVCPVAAQEYSYLQYDTKDGLAGSNVHSIVQDNDGYIWLGTETGLSRFDGTRFTTFTRADGLPSNEILDLMVDAKNRVWINSFKNAPCYYYKGKFYTQHNDPLLNKIRPRGVISGYIEATDGTILICDNYDVYVLPRGTGPAVHYRDADLSHLHPGYIVRKTSAAAREQFIPRQDRLPFYANQDFNYFYPGTGDPEDGYSLIHGDSIVTVLSTSAKPKLHVFKALRYALYLNDSVMMQVHRYGGVSLWHTRQEKRIESYLPEYRVQTVLQDREGNLWMGTRNNGLFRLNRFPFVNYHLGNGKSPLPVRDIYKKGKTLYVAGAEARLWLMQPADSARLLFRPVPVQKKITWAMSGLQRSYFNYANSDVFRLMNRKGFVDPGFKTVHIYQDTLLLATYGGAFRYRLPHMKVIDTVFPLRATCAYKQGAVIYVGTLDGLYAVKNGAATYYGDRFPVLKNRISTFAEGGDGTLWIATYEEGVVGLRNGEVIAHVDREKSGISSNISRCLFVSKEALWVGTEKGINKIPLNGPSRLKVEAIYRAEDGLQSEIINAVYTEDNIVYAGTEAGLTIFDESKVPRHSLCRIYMTEISVNGVSRPINASRLILPPGKSNMRFRFAGMSFLSSSSIRYRYRLAGLQEEWQYTSDPVLNFASLPSGKYTLQVMAINKFGDKSNIVQQPFEIQSLLWEKTWFRMLLVAVMLLLVFMLLQARIGWVRKKEKKRRSVQQQLMQLEQMALRAQMNPHFIFNCLNSIQHFILNQDVAGANFYLGRFASLVRQTLDNAAQIYLSLEEEIKYLTNYLELERLQAMGSFTYAIVVDDSITPEKVQLPNMVIQPFVENAIKHGVGRLRQNGHILLRFSSIEAAILECIIEDNGPGFAAAKGQVTAPRRPSGTSITLKRINILNEMSEKGSRITFDIQETKNDKGNHVTRVIIHFPLNVPS